MYVCVPCHISELTAKTPVTRLKLVSVTLGWVQNSAGNYSCLELAPPRRCPASLQGEHCFHPGEGLLRAPTGSWRGPFACISFIAARAPFPSGNTGNHRDAQLLSATNVRSNFSGGRSNFLRFEFTRAMVLYTTDVDCFNFFITIRVRYVTEYLMRNNGSSSADLVWGTLSGSRTPPRLGCLIVGRGPALIIYNAFTSRFFRERKVCYALSLRTLQR